MTPTSNNMQFTLNSERPLRILILASEITPFAKTGGVADVVGALPKALHALGHDVRVAMPLYGRIDPARFHLGRVVEPFPVPLDSATEDASIFEGKLDSSDVPAYLIDNKRFFDREGIYMYPDDAERFVFFSRAALEMLKRLDWRPDVIHCNDWQTALIPNWLRTIYSSDPFFADTATVYTIHNLAYQGIFGHRVLEIAGLASYGFIAHPDIAPEINQVIDFMARGILFADEINTVSETYAREIQTPENGEKLDPILHERQEHLSGILNGIDVEAFDPARDPNIAQTYGRDSLDRRSANKAALQKEAGLPLRADVPVIAMVGRLNEQKGADLVKDAIKPILDTMDVQFVLMGTGDQHYHDFFSQLHEQYPDRVAVFLTFNDPLARKIYAGSDMLLMPSRTEPSGTNQMVAMRYGCIPIVRATGGLADTVDDFDARADRGTGFVFRAYDAWATFAAITRAVQTYQFPEIWRRLQQRAMARDFSWPASANKYAALYHKAIAEKEQVIEAARALEQDIARTAEKLAALPARIARLGELAYNLWWSWDPQGRGVFQEIDPEVWQQVYHNPVHFLREVSPDKLRAASASQAFLQRYDAVVAAFDQYREAPITWFNATYPYLADQPIAYFSAEFGLHESLPIYSGGLGVLSGDHTKEASDLGLPFVGVGFLYPQGYFTQRLAPDGWQLAEYNKLNFALAPAVPAKDPAGREVMIHVDLPGRAVYAKVWRFQIGRVPLFLMDTDVDANAPADRELAARLYGGDLDVRISQEIVLGIGGVRALRALGYNPSVWHLNEGHSAFSVLERAREFVQSGMSFAQARETVRQATVFTTHTPVPAGNDAFPFDLMDKYFASYWKELGLTREQFLDLAWQDLPGGPKFSMTVLALRFAAAANGVSELHGTVSRGLWHFLWPDLPENQVPIGSITNGVHLPTWLAPEFQALFDKYFPKNWRDRMDDPALWNSLDAIPDSELWNTHVVLKRHLASFVNRLTRKRGADVNPDILTLGFARRFATYKRAVLMFRDLERLKRILTDPACPVQILFSGKAHPADDPGKQFIRQVVQFAESPGLQGHISFIEDYDILIARHLVQGVDVWTNTPRRPLEASGTSGEKAALNGVANLSVLDGWWREGYVAGKNGWAIGADQAWDDVNAQDAADAESFYASLEGQVVPIFYERNGGGIPTKWVQLIKNTIRTLAPKYSTRRMVKEYVTKYYVPAATR